MRLIIAFGTLTSSLISSCIPEVKIEMAIQAGHNGHHGYG